MNERALAWLNKQLKSKDMALFRAIHKTNASEKEIEGLENSIEILNYLIGMLEEPAEDQGESLEEIFMEAHEAYVAGKGVTGRYAQFMSDYLIAKGVTVRR